MEETIGGRLQGRRLADTPTLNTISGRGARTGRRERQPQGKCRAAALPRALGFGDAAVHLHQVTHDGQAQTQPAVAARDSAISLTETVEDEREYLAADAFAGVTYLYHRVRAVTR